MPTQKVEADNLLTFRFLAAGLRALPDRLGRECGLNTATIAAVQRAVDGWREQLARYLASDAKLWERTSAAQVLPSERAPLPPIAVAAAIRRRAGEVLLSPHRMTASLAAVQPSAE